MRLRLKDSGKIVGTLHGRSNECTETARSLVDGKKRPWPCTDHKARKRSVVLPLSTGSVKFECDCPCHKKIRRG